MHPEKLKVLLEDMERKLKNTTDLKSTGTVKAETFLLSEQTSVSKVRSFTVVSDEPESSGGKDLGPTPLEYFLASIGFCENVTFVRNAALMNVRIDELMTRVVGHWNRKGQFEIENKTPHFTDITVELSISTTEQPEKVREVARATFRRCPMHATISRATTVHTRLLVNGKEIEI